MDIGLQTFTVRKAQKKDPEAAYLPLIRLGIKKFEVARMDFSPKNAEKLKKMIDRYGIEICSIQVKPKYVFEEADRISEFCKSVGCKNVVISMLPFSCILGGEDKFYSFLSGLDRECEKYESMGLTLAYHHHHWEYITLSSGKTRMQELTEGTKKLKFVHDSYWAARCGMDSSKEIRKLGDRLLGVHLRDMRLKARGLSVLPTNCALGSGILDIKAIASAAIDAGAEYLVIEQKTNDPYKNIEKSYDYFNRIFKNGD